MNKSAKQVNNSFDEEGFASLFVRVMTSIVCIFADICCFAVLTCQITPSRKGRKNESYTEGNDTS